jgi:putative glycerol-1-phosphate prenyltransferase
MENTFYKSLLKTLSEKKKILAILIDPEKFKLEQTATFLRNLPTTATHIFVGGSTVAEGLTEAVVNQLKLYTAKPIVLFPGDVTQITPKADAILFLSLLSGRNPDYLIGKHLEAVQRIRGTVLQVLPTGYLLIDGGNESAVAKVTKTKPLARDDIREIVDTAIAAAYLGMKLVYLEAGSGAINPVSPEVISAVKKEIGIPLLVGGGIRTEAQKQAAFDAGADIVVMGTAFEV